MSLCPLKNSYLIQFYIHNRPFGKLKFHDFSKSKFEKTLSVENIYCKNCDEKFATVASHECYHLKINFKEFHKEENLIIWYIP